MADEQRMAVLEQHVRALYEQIGALRSELAAREQGAPRRMTPEPAEPARASSMPPPPPPPHSLPPSPPPRPKYDPKPDIDIEKLVGRYGTIAVASLAILMGVGTFLSWAIEHGYLGPTVRVILRFIV